MPVNMGEMGPGLGCSCRAFRMGEPTPEQALAALARSANVTVTDMGAFRDGTHEFGAWTDPKNRYSVAFDENKPGGWCKHCIAALAHWAPWHRRLALGADEALAEIKNLRKELKARDREIRKLRSV